MALVRPWNPPSGSAKLSGSTLWVLSLWATPAFPQNPEFPTFCEWMSVNHSSLVLLGPALKAHYLPSCLLASWKNAGGR